MPNDPSSSTLLALKASSKSKSIESKTSSDRHRDILLLIFSYLQSHGYHQTAAQLQIELSGSSSSSSYNNNNSSTTTTITGGLLSGGSFQNCILHKYEHADNIDLMQIIIEYEDYYHFKFGKKPKFSRVKINGNNEHTKPPNTAIYTTSRRKSSHRKLLPTTMESTTTTTTKQNMEKTIMTTRSNYIMSSSYMNENDETRDKQNHSSIQDHEMSIHGTLVGNQNSNQSSQQSNSNSNLNNTDQEKILKPLPTFDGDNELRSLASSIQREILDTSPGIYWDDIIDLDDAKKLLKEAVTLPIQYPQLFHYGLLQPWRGILLYGPPGTGKTLLAKAVATESNTTFFNISASSIVSKFRGDSEKLIKVLFQLARYHSPSTIFFDEIDSILGHRGGGGSGGSYGGASSSSFSSLGGMSRGVEGMEHEGSRRMKTELLVEMDGLGRGDEHVFILAATNLPWDLDMALLRRLEKRIMVDLPTTAARKKMIQYHLDKHVHNLKEEDFERIATLTENYSGADIKLLCKEAAMRPVRVILKKLEEANNMNICNQRNLSSSEINIEKLMQQNPITSNHVECSLDCTRVSANIAIFERYRCWEKLHGSSI